MHGFGGGPRGLLEQEVSKPKNVNATLGRLGRLFGPFWLMLLLVLVLVVGSTYVQVVTPELIGQSVDCYLAPATADLFATNMGGPSVMGAAARGSTSAANTGCWFATSPLGTGAMPVKATPQDYVAGLGRMVLVLVILYVLGSAMSGLLFYVMSWTGQHVLKDLRINVFKHLHELSLSYYAEHESGAVMSRITNDMDTLQQAISFVLVQVLSGLLLIVWIGIVMLQMSVPYALVSMAVIPLMIIATWWFSGQARKAFRRTRVSIGNVNADLQQSISGVREVQAFGREDANIESFRVSNAANRDANIKAVSFTAALAPTLEALGYLGIAITTVTGGLFLLRNQTLFGATISIGLIITFLQYVQRFNQPIQQISVLWANLQSAIAGAERIFGLLDTQPDVVDKADAQVMPQIAGQVTFDQVDAAYNEEERVLCGVSFVAEPGQTIAVVGPTGAGKTTIINLIPRFYDVVSGAVRIDGLDVRDVTAASLRQADRHRAAGHLPVQRHGDEQHPLRPARRDRRGGPGGRATGPGRRVHPAPAGQVRHDAGRARQRAEPGPAAAPRHRPRRAGRPAHPDPGRGHLQRGHPHRAPHPAGAGHPAQGPDELRHRPPPQHHPQRRPGAGAGGRRDRRARQARRAAGPPRGLL